jgi:hypothetical protein
MTRQLVRCSRTRFSRASRPRRMEASSSRFASPGFCGRCSSRSICLRLRSMNFRHSGAVIVSKFSESRSTFFADIFIPRDECRFSVSVSPIMPERMASAKQIRTDLESRRGRGCDTSAPVLWQVGHVQGWCKRELLSTTSSDSYCNDFPLGLRKGDKSERITTLNFWLPSTALFPTFSSPVTEQE